MYNYIYYGLSKVVILDVENLLLSLGHTDIKFSSGGFKINAVSVKTSAKKPLNTGILVTQEEYDSLDRYRSSIGTSNLEKIHVIETYDELIKFIEKEHGIDLEPKVEPASDVLSSEGVEQKDEQVEYQTEPTPEPDVEPKEELLGHFIAKEGETNLEAVSVSGYNSKPKSEWVSVKQSEPVDGLAMLEYEALVEERNSLVAEVESLNIKLKQKSSVDENEFKELQKQYEKTTENLEVLKTNTVELSNKNDLLLSENNRLKKYVEELEETNKEQGQKLLQLSAQLADSSIKTGVEDSPIKVPANIKFYVTASALSTVTAYQHLLSNYPETIIVDLARESIIDSLVKITKSNRITKWLFEGQNIRASFTSFENLAVNVSRGISLLSSPTVILQDDVLEKIDWVSRLEELSSLDKQVIVYLGTFESHGVSQLISRLSTPVTVMHTNLPLEVRALNKIKYLHEFVSEVVL